MDQSVRDEIGCISCTDCKYSSLLCKRVVNKKYSFAKPWFSCSPTGYICSDFDPNWFSKYLRDHWTNFDDYVGVINYTKFTPIIVNGDQSVRYYVYYKDYAYNNHIDKDGNLRWVKRCYLKRVKESSENPVGYKMIWEYNNEVSDIMTIDRIAQLDCREDANKKIIQGELKKIKPLSKLSGDEEVPFYMLEKLVTVLSKKYNVRVKEFTPDIWTNKDSTIWRSVIICDKDLKIIKLIYGLSMYEIFAKSALYMYYVKDQVGKRGNK